MLRPATRVDDSATSVDRGFDERRTGDHWSMQWKKRIRVNREGVSIAADVNVVADVNYKQSDAVTRSRSVSGSAEAPGTNEPRKAERPDEPEKHEGERKEPA